ncbi:MAG: hypothetical protein AAF004_06045 [Pseudomonadota bacterium]
MANLFDELRKRHVIRVAGMYAVAGWLMIEVGMALETTLNLPGWFDTMITVLVLIGFPIALILAWAFDITPEGIQRTPSDVGATPAPASGGRTLDLVIIAGLAVIAGVATWQAIKTGSDDTTTATATVATPVSEEDQSIAVLPFVALSTNQDDAFFGKGISEELLNSLAKFPGLKVAARTSAFSFEGQNIDLREVGEKLGVAHVLEGSVRRSGNKLRITAQLIRATDGFHLWSETYDRQMTDIFEIQDEIVGQLSKVLQFRLGVGAGAGRASETRANPQAYEMYLKGLDYWWQRELLDNRAAAVSTFLRTTELDPNFADGWAAYANSVALSSPVAWPHLTRETMRPAVGAAYAKALALEPDNVRALAGLGYWHTNAVIDIAKAMQSLEAAKNRSPNDAFVQYILAQVAATTGDDRVSAAAMQRTLSDDPLNDTKRRVDFMLRAARGEFSENDVFARPFVEAIETCAPVGTCDAGTVAIALEGLLIPSIQAQAQASVERFSGLILQALDNASSAFSDDDLAMNRCLHDLLMQVHTDATPTNEIRECAQFVLDNTSQIDLIWMSTLAHAGMVPEAVEELLTSDNLRYALNNANVTFVLVDGPFEIPDDIRRHPRYHDWWARDGYEEIANARRANGKDAGLPLPIEPTDATNAI